MTPQYSLDDLIKEVAQLYGQGDFMAALDVVDRHAAEFPDAASRTTFYRICLLSMAGRTDDALDVFRHGLDRGFWWHETYLQDTDLDPIRELPEFKRLAAIAQEKYLEARDTIKPDRRLLMPEESTKPLPLLVALHGRAGNAGTDLRHWEVARQRGWLVLSPQSTNPLSPGVYCWDDPKRGLADICFHYDEIVRDYSIDSQRVVVTGFSQGSGMALYAALSRKIPARGHIGIGTWWADVESLSALTAGQPSLRAYFVTGERDQTLDRSLAIQNALRIASIPIAAEVHSDIGHEFSPDFSASFEKAIAFIFQEAE